MKGASFSLTCLGFFAELHSTLEAVRQRHRQCLGLCSWRDVCQSHLCWGQQSHCKCFKVLPSKWHLREIDWRLCLPVLQAEKMVTEIKQAFEDGLMYVSWMDTETKKAAKEKVGIKHPPDALWWHLCMNCFLCRSGREMQHCHLLWKYVSYKLSSFTGRCNIQHGRVSWIHHEWHETG